MNSNSELSIRAILTMIQTSTEEFSIGFVKVDGSERIIKKRVRLGVPPSEAKVSRLQAEGLTNSPTESGKDWNHQLNKSHNLLLFDLEKNRPFEVKIPLIMEFNNILVRWYNEKQK